MVFNFEDEKNTSNKSSKRCYFSFNTICSREQIKKAALLFISNQFDIQKEEIEPKEIFKSLVTPGKGQLSRELFRKNQLNYIEKMMQRNIKIKYFLIFFLGKNN